MRPRYTFLVLALTLVGFAGRAPEGAGVSEGGPSELQVRGALLYNFMKFVEWPPAALTDPLIVGVMGAVSIADIEASFAGRQVQGRSVTVRPVTEADLTGPCHVIYVATDDAARLRRVLRQLGTRPVLTVSDVPDAPRPDAVINFVPVDTRVGFQIHLGLARASGLQISSKLLQLAQTVRNTVDAREP